MNHQLNPKKVEKTLQIPEAIVAINHNQGISIICMTSIGTDKSEFLKPLCPLTQGNLRMGLEKILMPVIIVIHLGASHQSPLARVLIQT